MRLKRDTQRKARSGTILRLKRAQLLSSSDPYNCHQFVPSAHAPELEHETVNCPLFVPVCRLGLSPCRFRGSRLDAFHHCHKSLSSCDWDSQLQYSQRTFAAPLMQLFALNWSFLRLSPKQICIIWALRSRPRGSACRRSVCSSCASSAQLNSSNCPFSVRNNFGWSDRLVFGVR